MGTASSYLDKNAKKDETLTQAGSGSAVLVKGSAGDITALTVNTATQETP